MRVFLAGATGAIGRPLVRRLIEAGHSVVGTTRSPVRAEGLRAAGAESVVLDATDAEALSAALAAARPEVVIHQLTDLPQSFNPRKVDYSGTNRLRAEVTGTLVEAALAASAKRMITQSIAFIYAPLGGMVKSEADPVMGGVPGPFGTAIAATLEAERLTTRTPGIEGIALRYGWFYGPGTYYGPGGSTTEDVRRRRLPVVGPGAGVFSFIHVEDAAAATVAAIGSGRPGSIYNITDDEPAAQREWLPVFAEAIGAKRPRRVPLWLAKRVAGPGAAMAAEQLRGASNQLARLELDWAPSRPSWRQGFREGPP